jgi:hypothetical protein
VYLLFLLKEYNTLKGKKKARVFTPAFFVYNWRYPGFFCFLRKEVIQPHLPVRLPCYDFALLAKRTLIAFLSPKRVGKKQFQVPSTQLA